MAFHSSVSFVPLHNAAFLIETDQRALADQLVMCHTERRRWRHLAALAVRAQSFAAQRLMSSVLLGFMVFGTVSWLVG
jgi:hypothetical protein